MSEEKKLLGENRREFLLQLLKESSEPIIGGELAKLANVSRQVIVNDITLLKAKNEPIIATSQGYLYLRQPKVADQYEKTIACHHTPEQAESELNLIVDHGVTVKDVKIEHPVYGDLTASIMVSNRREVKQFVEKIQATKAIYLSNLTHGVHIHTIVAKSKQQLVDVEKALNNAGFLMNLNE
ncbi:transcription repressor NadR [Heyndrickxia vini]|uniref:Transcription repressor NadR n=1 Tax=Heyndrickxia vini TaxID=1476025 RepID=A0ABX7E8N8_9BACI|nr:transcription repressor NadR [Heyndrickxia vini]QQZ10732.1 transcription repressor NadR [Heyndrickxia vini]